MFRKLRASSKNRPHLFSLLSAIFFLAAVTGISFACHWVADGGQIHSLLLFIFFLIPISCGGKGYLYGITYSFFAVLWLRFLYSSALGAYPVIFAGMSAIAVLVNVLTSRSTAKPHPFVEPERRFTETDMDQTRANLLRAISHDLRTPLAGILGNSLIYLENKKTLAETERINIVTNIHRDSCWLINLVENLLAVTRIRNDTMEINESEELVEEVISEALQKIEKRHPNCMIHVKIPENFILLPMDAMLIEQVTINLLENAILHSGSAAPVDIVVENEPEYVSFTVRDYGSGIPENMQEDLFQGIPYFPSRAADAQKGAGIGLAICKTIIAAHHGTIQGRNHENGAEFIFTLPKGKQEKLS